MAAATIGDVITRLVALFDAISGINTAVDGWPDDAFGDAALPAVVVLEDPATYTKALDNRAYDDIRAYTATLLVQKVLKGKRGTDSSGRAAVRPWLQTIPNTFMGNLTLASSGNAGLAGVRMARLSRSSAPQTFKHGEDDYWGALFEFVITTNIRL